MGDQSSIDISEAGETSPPRVSFSDFSQLIVLESLLSPDDKEKIWYSSHDIEAFRTEASDLARGMLWPDNKISLHQYKEKINQDTDAILGLDIYLTKEMLQQVLLHRQLHHRAVLGEQQRQRRSSVNDPQRLADVSQADSSWSRNRARSVYSSMPIEDDTATLTLW